MHATSQTCTCSQIQIHQVGCDCGGTPVPSAPSFDIDAFHAELEARSEAEQMELYRAAYAEAEARGWAWDPRWGDQPTDEHIRAWLTATGVSVH